MSPPVGMSGRCVRRPAWMAGTESGWCPTIRPLRTLSNHALELACRTHFPPAPPPGPPRPPEPPINESPHPVPEPSDGFEHQPLEDRAQILQAMVEHSSDALLVSSKDDEDPMTRVCFVNEAFTALLGVEIDDLVGRSPGVLVGADTDLGTLRRVEAGLRRGEVVTVELILADRDGDPTRVEATYRLISTSSGVSWSLARFRDVSDRHEAAAALRRSEVWAEALVQGSSDLVMVADTDGIIRYASPALREVLGYDAEEFVTRPFVELIHPDDAGPDARGVRAPAGDAGWTEPRVPDRASRRLVAGDESAGRGSARRSGCAGVRGQPARRVGPAAGGGSARRAGRPARGHRQGRAARDHARQDRADDRAPARRNQRGHRSRRRRRCHPDQGQAVGGTRCRRLPRRAPARQWSRPRAAQRRR